VFFRRHFAPGHAVVTGAASGLGREIAAALLRDGWQVACVDLPEVLARAGADDPWPEGRPLAVGFDVRDAAGWRSLHDRLRGEWPVDLLVNNAAGNFVCPSERLSANAWRAVLGIALDGTFYCSKAFGRAMLKQRAGAILNIVATYAWTGMPGVVHSASAKAGVLAMTKTMAAEWAGRGVRVNAIAPVARTRLTEASPASADLVKAPGDPDVLDRFAPERISPLVVHLASPACTFTGQVFGIDGGRISRYRGWTPVEQRTSETGWTLDSVAAALADLPPTP